jgi:5-methylcytosine-specific restriction endonuclease McrA
VGFCTDCHNSTNRIWSSNLGRNLRTIDWSAGLKGEKHGAAPRDGTDHFQAPYSTAGKSNMVLSCLDCHEPHGSENISLIRRQVNGGPVTMSSTNNMQSLCGRCHSTNWEYIHHYAPDRPYARFQCASCHSGGGGWGGSGGGWGQGPIHCGNCHFHGSDDSWAGSKATGRKTF